MSKLLSSLVGTFAIGLFIGCWHNSSDGHMRQGKVSASIEQQAPLADNKGASVTIKSLEFRAWWWSEEQIAKGIYEDNALLPRNAYIKLNIWQDIGDPTFPHPEVIEVICTIENKGSYQDDFVVSATGDFKVASYNWIEKKNSDKTIDQALDQKVWTDKVDLEPVTVEKLAPGESKEVTLKEINLRNVFDKYSSSEDDDRWPYRLRARVTIKTLSGIHVAQGEVVLPLVPGN